MKTNHGRAAILFGAGLTLFAAISAWFRFDRKNGGIPGFLLWKRVSRNAHGGRYFERAGIRLYYETFGDGPPVIVLHGGTAFLETMHHQITLLAVDHLVVAPDSRGHGRSSDGVGPLHYADMADDVIGLMDLLQIQTADVIGWSDGGVIGLDLAIRHPDRVGRLVTIGSNFDVDGLVDPESPIPADSRMLDDVRDFYERVSPTPENWPAFYAKIVSMWRSEPHYPLARLQDIRRPVLVIAGEHDAIRREHTAQLVDAIPDAQELIVSGATHLVPLEKPRILASAIRAFLS